MRKISRAKFFSNKPLRNIGPIVKSIILIHRVLPSPMLGTPSKLHLVTPFNAKWGFISANNVYALPFTTVKLLSRDG